MNAKTNILNESYIDITFRTNKYELSNTFLNEIYISETIIEDNKENEKSNIPNITTELDNIKNRTELINDIIEKLITEYNLTKIDNGEDEIKDVENIEIILTSTLNQKKSEKNISMDLGQCEDALKYIYNISKNSSLYILQIISKEKGMKIPKIEYEIYYPLNNNNLTKLNLSLCIGTKIDILISVKINDTLDKYNPKSNYYNNICTKTTSNDGTDISLKDRRIEFINNNMSLCEENCDLINYNYNNSKIKCSCYIKLNTSSNYDIKFNKNDFFKSFIDIKNIFNLSILKCYKTVLKIKSLGKNYGCFIITFVILLYFITLFIFCVSSYDQLKKEIKKIYLTFKFNENAIKLSKYQINGNIKKEKLTKKVYIKQNKILENKIKRKKLIKSGKEKKIHFILSTEKNDKSNIKINTNSFRSFNNIKKIYYKKIINKKDFELNLLNYKEALVFDKRSYSKYYNSLLTNNHPFVFSFFCYDDYNSNIIKFFLFFFSFSLDFTINALFFNDETMHKIYEDKGVFNILYQLPQILYSTLISRFIDSLIKNYALSQDNIVQFKNSAKMNIIKKYLKLLRILKYKFIFFFIITFIILLLFWYYVVCFCGIYINTQNHLIKDSIISLLMSLIIPVFIYIIPGIFRIPSLRKGKSNHSKLYKFSVFLQNLLI